MNDKLLNNGHNLLMMVFLFFPSYFQTLSAKDGIDKYEIISKIPFKCQDKGKLEIGMNRTNIASLSILKNKIETIDWTDHKSVVGVLGYDPNIPDDDEELEKTKIPFTMDRAIEYYDIPYRGMRANDAPYELFLRNGRGCDFIYISLFYLDRYYFRDHIEKRKSSDDTPYYHTIVNGKYIRESEHPHHRLDVHFDYNLRCIKQEEFINVFNDKLSIKHYQYSGIVYEKTNHYVKTDRHGNITEIGDFFTDQVYGKEDIYIIDNYFTNNIKSVFASFTHEDCLKLLSITNLDKILPESDSFILLH